MIFYVCMCITAQLKLLSSLPKESAYSLQLVHTELCAS